MLSQRELRQGSLHLLHGAQHQVAHDVEPEAIDLQRTQRSSAQRGDHSPRCDQPVLNDKLRQRGWTVCMAAAEHGRFSCRTASAATLRDMLMSTVQVSG